MTAVVPQFIQDHPSDLWYRVSSRACGQIHTQGAPTCTTPSLVLWRNVGTSEWYAEQVGPHICISELWARFTRITHDTDQAMRNVLGFASPHAPWQIDGKKGPLKAGLRVQLHTVNGSWLWVLRSVASCGGWDATWPD